VVAVDRDESDLRPLLFFRGHYAALEEG
jgi:hypothetical protein